MIPGVINMANPDFHYGKTATQNAQPFQFMAVHHTADKPIENLVKYGQTVDAGRGGAFGYHYYIGRDGRVIQGAPLEKRTNHIKPPKNAARSGSFGGASNSNTIGISLVGGADGETPEQIKAAENLSRRLMAIHGIGPESVFGHGEIQSDRQHTEGEALVNLLRGVQVADASGDGWTEVTDPAILQQLNGVSVSGESDGWVEETDPAILAQLNGGGSDIALSRPRRFCPRWHG